MKSPELMEDGYVGACARRARANSRLRHPPALALTPRRRRGRRCPPRVRLATHVEGLLRDAACGLLLPLVLTGCAESNDPPDKVVRNFLQAKDSAMCQYITAPQAKLCRRPRAPEPPQRIGL
jgi:hypothetical protein